MSGPTVELLPIELFCKIAVKLPIADILRLGATSKKMRRYTQTYILWQQLIERDLGKDTLNEYHSQQYLCSGQESPHDYYLNLFQTFDKKVKDFIAFSKALIESKGGYTDTYSSVLAVCAHLEETTSSYESWSRLDSSNKLMTFPAQYKKYLADIDYIAIENRHEGILSDYLKFMVYQGFEITALSLVKSKKISLHAYENVSLAFSPVAIPVDKCQPEILDEILRKENTNSIFSNRVLCYLFLMEGKIGDKRSILVHLLNRCPPSSSKVLFALIHYTRVTMLDLLCEVTTMVHKTTSLQDKLNILENSIAVVDGKYSNALSLYFHTVKSPLDAVARIKSHIENVISQSTVSLEVTINPPTITVLDENTFNFASFDMSYVDKSLDKLVDDLKEYDSDFLHIKNVSDVTESGNLIFPESEISHPISTITNPAIVNITAQEGLSVFKLQTLGRAVLSIGVGLALGLGLGLGAHVHIAATVLSSVISAALACELSVRYNYHRFMGPEPTSTSSTTATYRPSVVASSTTPGNTLNSSHVNESRINSVC